MTSTPAQRTHIGIVFGCYIPLHAGHIAMIDQARTENKHVIIGVTGHDLDRGKDFIPFLRRVALMSETYHNDRTAYICPVDDKKIGLTETFSQHAWKLWCGELFAQSPFNPESPRHEFHWYTGEQAYIDKIKSLYPNHTFHLLDRTIIPISGTAVRENPMAHRKDIHPRFWEYLKIMGHVS